MRLRAAAALLLGLAATLTGYLVCLNLRDRSEDRALAGEARAATLAVRALSSNTERAIWSGFAVVLTSDGNPETFARMMPIASPAVLAGGRLYRAEGDTLAMTAEFGSPKLSKEPTTALFEDPLTDAPGVLDGVRFEGRDVRISVFAPLLHGSNRYVIALDYRFPFSNIIRLFASAGTGDIGLELYSGGAVDPARLMMSTRDPSRSVLRTVSAPIDSVGFSGLIVLSAHTPLTTGLTRVLPVLAAGVGLLLTLAFTFLGWLMSRRRLLLDQLTREKVRLDLAIADHPRTLAEIEANAERYRRILDSSPDVMMTVALATSRISVLNRRDVFGRLVAGLELADFAALFDEASRLGFERSVALVSEGAETLEGEARFEDVDRDHEWVRYRLAAVADADADADADVHTPTHLVVVLTSIDEHKRADETQRQLERQLRQAQRLEALGQLAGGVAHDLNNVLAAILSLAELVGMDDLTAQARADVTEIKKSSRRGADLVRQLLVFARRDPSRPTPLSLNEVVTEMQSLLTRTLSHSIELEVVLGSELPSVLADHASIEQILMNLAVNARDAMNGQGHLTLETSLTWVDAGYAETRPGVVAGPYVRLTVTDDGCGMTPDVQARMFDPFFTTKAIGEGTGLGLATVYGIVTQVGGHIEVYSEPAKGTAFKICFPLAAMERALQATEPLLAPGSGVGQRILLAEDDESLRLTTQRLLARQGYEVLVASDGPSALALAEHQRFDLALVDMVMPGGLSGRDVVARLRQGDPGLPAVFVSGYSEAVMARHGELEAGSVLLEKPFAADDLLRLVATTLRSARLAP